MEPLSGPGGLTQAVMTALESQARAGFDGSSEAAGFPEKENLG